MLLKIGEELSIPVDIEYDSKDVLDVELVKLPIEDAIRKLSPNIQLYLRADLSHSERRALRIVLIDPAKTSMNGS